MRGLFKYYPCLTGASVTIARPFFLNLFAVVTVLAAGVSLGNTARAQAQCPPGQTCVTVPQQTQQQNGNTVVVVPQQQASQPQQTTGSTQVIVVQPAQPPAPVVVVQPTPQQAAPAQPAPAQAQQAAPQVVTTTAPAPKNEDKWMVSGRLTGLAGPDYGLGGAMAGLRYRPQDGHVAIGAAVGLLGSGGDNEDVAYKERFEVPIFIEGALYFNPQHVFQVYAVGALGVSVGRQTFEDAGGEFEEDFTYTQAELGLGLEVRLSDALAIFGDVRGFVRERADETDEPEYIEVDEFGDPTGRTTNASGGAVINLGAALYF